MERLHGKTLVLLLSVPLIVAALSFSGWLEPLNRRILDFKFQWLTTPASGEITVVEIDAGTIGAIGVWPFPRRTYADLIRRLGQAGARTVAIDIDFSSYSTEEDDLALRSAIDESAAQIILPSFVQEAGRSSVGEQLIERSATQFERAGSGFGSVNVTPEDDSKIWRYEPFQDVDGRKNPSLAVLLAEGRVTADRFLIDFGIDYDSIPFLSMRNVLDGDFDHSLIKGKRVVIGATAIELGDKFPVPRYGYLPGVYVQTLAAESLLLDRALRSSNMVTTLVGLLLLLPLGYLILTRSWLTSSLPTIGVGVAFLAVCVGLQAATPLVLEVGAWLLALAGWWFVKLLRTLQEQGLRLFRQRIAGVYRRELMRRVVSDSFDGIVMSDSRGFIEQMNGTAERLLQTSLEKVRGESLSAVFSQEAYEQIRLRLESEQSGERFEMSIPFGQHEVADIEMTVGVTRVPLSKSPFERRTTEREIHVLTFRDISERKIVESEKAEALREAQRANEMKSQFLASVSHELRTPLNAILGFSDIMQMQAFGPMENPRYLEYAGSINQSGRFLLELIDSILDVSRVESGEDLPKLVNFEVEKLLEECREVMLGQSAGALRVWDFQVDQDVAVFCADQRLLRQVFINLLTNAFKFTSEQGRIQVIVRRADDDHVIIEVTDNGCGIPKAEQEQIFEPFRQASSAYVRHAAGAGLGLYIVQRIVSAHGGEIEVESEPDKGATFRIRLAPDFASQRSQAFNGEAAAVL
ncbi:ATP-binding protein [Nisaea nitritireducens]|uniref:ATP-binding protein n=1 Tax=Nisaea nitritireducens TaxID=568392 RepID=UPI001866A73F|nr:CHASE2 domain-containing protein [Nisaea nitritireducens]